jgi:hypothetical protein
MLHSGSLRRKRCVDASDKPPVIGFFTEQIRLLGPICGWAGSEVGSRNK